MAQLGEIAHRFIQTSGIKMHIAEQGSGPLVLLLHGFPELWYSWRHQIPVLAKAGYHVVAPDLRGYGQTEAPSDVQAYSTQHIVGDIIELLHELNEEGEVFVVGHDWGAVVGWDLCLFRPDKVKAFAALSVPFQRPGFSMAPVAAYGEDFYVNRFQEPGRAEAEFGSYDTKALLKRILLCTKSDAPIAPKGQSIVEFFEEKQEATSWATEEDFDYMAENYNKSGFTGPLNYYRCMKTSWQLKARIWKEAKIQVPVLYITGENDLAYSLGKTRDYVEKGGLKSDVPKLEGCIVLEGAAHFLHEEKHEELNELLLGFLSKHRA